jgi:uncharacterized protein YeaO (DUF488 family)
VLLGIRRIYEKASITDGRRILVDRLWPRGVRKSTSNIDFWMKEIAPSEKLRKWFNHSPERWKAFRRRYEAELKKNPALKALQEKVRTEDVTLVYAASDEKRNNAVVLASFLKSHAPKPKKEDIGRKVADDLEKELQMYQ